jgi:RNA polymerase sigma factor (sigma-70 family)
VTATPLPDVELLSRWADGCRQSGDALIERHFAALHRFFRDKVGAELEDLIQQTLLACLEARFRYEGTSSFRAFLLGIARNQLLTYYAKRQRLVGSGSTDSLPDFRTSPSGIFARQEDERMLLSALQHLPIDSRIILELAYFEDLDGADLACACGVSVNTVYTRLHRAKARLAVVLRTLSPDHPRLDRALRL